MSHANMSPVEGLEDENLAESSEISLSKANFWHEDLNDPSIEDMTTLSLTTDDDDLFMAGKAHLIWFKHVSMKIAMPLMCILPGFLIFSRVVSECTGQSTFLPNSSACYSNGKRV